MPSKVFCTFTTRLLLKKVTFGRNSVPFGTCKPRPLQSRSTDKTDAFKHRRTRQPLCPHAVTGNSRARYEPLSARGQTEAHLLEGPVGAVHVDGPAAALGGKGRAEADVVFGRGADEGRVRQAGQHVEGGGQHRGVGGDAQGPVHGTLGLLQHLVVQPLRHQVLRGGKHSFSGSCARVKL